MDTNRFALSRVNSEDIAELQAWIAEHGWDLVCPDTPGNQPSVGYKRNRSAVYARGLTHVTHPGKARFIVREKTAGRIVATAFVKCDPLAAYLSDLCVQKEYRAMGIGMALLEARLAFAREQGSQEAIATVRLYNAPMRTLCLSRGFRPVVDTTAPGERFFLPLI